MGCSCSLGATRRKHGKGPCPTGCVSYCKIPTDSYFRYCGGQSGYKKVGKRKTVRGALYSGGAVEMLLKGRGWAEKSAHYYPVKGCPCVRRVGRDLAVAAAERHVMRKYGIKRARKAA